MPTLPIWLSVIPWPVVKSIAKTYTLDPILIASIIMVESAGNPCAIRYEPHWRYYPATNIMRDLGSHLNLSMESVKVSMATSWGPMQIMGTVAFEHGFRDHFTKLCRPKVGIEYGCKHFKTLVTRYGNVEDAVAAYNAGSVRKTDGGMYVNEQYVDKVMNYFRDISKVYSL